MALPNIFGVDLAGIVNDALGPLVFDQILIKISSVRDEVDPTKMVKTRVPYACKGFIDDFIDGTFKGTTIKVNDRKIVILGASLPTGIEPEPNDEITAEGETFSIASDGVLRDPAGATFECKAQ